MILAIYAAGFWLTVAVGAVVLARAWRDMIEPAEIRWGDRMIVAVMALGVAALWPLVLPVAVLAAALKKVGF